MEHADPFAPAALHPPVDLTVREWRWVVGSDAYVVGDDGSVWSRRSLNGNGFGRWHRLVGNTDKGGYLRVLLRHGKRKSRPFVHHLVLAAFGRERPPGSQTRHLNGKRQDNRILNLAWGSASENAADREAHGYSIRGAGHGMAKLDELAVRDIRLRVAAGETRASLAIEYGVGRSAVGRLVSGQSWRSVA